MVVERVKSGVPGLDKMLEGGYPKNAVVLVSGGPGTGKTTFALQYIYYGAKHNEPGVYVTFEQEADELKHIATRFGMDFDKLEREGKVNVIRVKNIVDIGDVIKEIKRAVKKIKAKRLVIDSISSIEIFATTFRSMIREIPAEILEAKYTITPPTDAIIRRLMYRIIDFFKGLGVTTLLIAEARDSTHSRYGVAEFVTDGLIRLDYEVLGKELARSLLVVKMRQTKIDGGQHAIDFTKNGIEIID